MNPLNNIRNIKVRELKENTTDLDAANDENTFNVWFIVKVKRMSITRNEKNALADAYNPTIQYRRLPNTTLSIIPYFSCGEIKIK
jgi:hypothetical protein